MLDWYRELIRLRRDTPALTDPDLSKVDVRFSEDPAWLVIERGDVTIACNFGDTECDVPIDEARRWKVLLTSDEPKTANGIASLPGTSVTIWGGPTAVPARLPI
jgi:maltooligosyltrehalose trehalohydrolase